MLRTRNICSQEQSFIHICLLRTLHIVHPVKLLSSPCAESARAFTGRRNSHSGRGEDFLTGQPDFFYGNSCNSGTESRKMVSKVGN